MSDILLTTLNARYIHASLGLRYLMANMAELREQTVLHEFTINQRIDLVAEEILAMAPKIVGIGVYIWNVEETRKLVALLKTIRPELIIVLGGPEVTYEVEAQPWLKHVDYVITGMADLEFAELCQSLLADDAPKNKVIRAIPPRLTEINLPYAYYSDEDLRQRVIYVEASRGCPFKCEFCLSALDKTATPFESQLFFDAMQDLYDRGTRNFKFIDRTFNLKIQASLNILNFFLEKLKEEPVYLHFELIPDRLPDALKEKMTQFPEGSLQFEIGVQSFTPEVQSLISRRQDNEKTCENLRWIREETQAHIHADLIFGLPGETLESFAASFDKLYALRPHEIQLGILKRLRGTPIIRHTAEFALRFNPEPPYNIVSNSTVDFPTMQAVGRVARYWDMIGNSGRFTATTELIAGNAPFMRFMQLSQWLFERSGQTHKISLKNLFNYIYHCLIEELGEPEPLVMEAISQDYLRSGQKGSFKPSSIQPPDVSVSLQYSARQQRHTA